MCRPHLNPIRRETPRRAPRGKGQVDLGRLQAMLDPILVLRHQLDGAKAPLLILSESRSIEQSQGSMAFIGTEDNSFKHSK